MTAFATATDFASRLGVDLTGSEQTDADTLLAIASDLIREEVGQTISVVEDDEATFRGSASRRFRLPQRPVGEITSVVLNGVELNETDDWYLDGDELVRSRWSAFNEQHFSGFGGGWGDPGQVLVVTYTHGYETIPATVKAVCLEMVVRVWVNPGAVLGEIHGSEQVTYQRSGGLLLTADEKRIVDDALRRAAGSVALR